MLQQCDASAHAQNISAFWGTPHDPPLRLRARRKHPMSLSTYYQSCALACRLKRHALFLKLAAPLLASGPTVHLLDVGGTREYWTEMGGVPANLAVNAINPIGDQTWYPQETRWVEEFTATRADELKRIYGCDICFSNSTLAYVGDSKARADMAAQMQRKAPRIFLQTPNRWFPLDWRTLIPCFHWLPSKVRARVMSWLPRSTLHHSWQHFGKPYAECLEFVNQVEDVGYSELRAIFPKATILREKVGPFTKSFIVHNFN